MSRYPPGSSLYRVVVDVHNHTIMNARPPVEHSHANGIATQTRSPKISSLHAVITILFYACLSIHYVSASLPRIKAALPYRG